MFPLAQPTVLFLVWIGVVLISALAVRFWGRWSLPLMLLASALPIGLLWSDPPKGEYAGLAYISVFGGALAMMVLGAVFGGALRKAGVTAKRSVAGIVSAAGASVAAVLWYQYVPEVCTERPLPVRIAGETLSIPPEMQPRLESGASIAFFGRIDRKHDYARVCRMSRNGMRAIEMDAIWITPAANHQRMTTTCEQTQSTSWCGTYTADPYHRIAKILIQPESNPAVPAPYWRDGGSLQKDKQGDLNEGSLCISPGSIGPTHCWIWQPFGDGARLVVSNSNTDPENTDMSTEEALDMILQAREMTLSILQH